MGLSNRHERGKWLRLVFVLVFASLLLGGLALTAESVLAQGDGTQTTTGEGDGKKDEGIVRSYLINNVYRLVHVFITSLLFSPDSWWIGVIFLIMSVLAGILVVILLIDLRLGIAIPLGFVEEFSNMVNRRAFKQAFDLCRSDNSFLARVMSAGMGRLQYGIEDARHAAGNMVESIRRGKDQMINYVAVIGTIAPLIGLFGTVWGMIGAFQVIESAYGDPKPQQIAGQISQSLSTTWVGILLAVPMLFFNTYFRNRLTRMTMDTSNLADDLLTQMFHNSKKGGGGAAVPIGGPTPAPAPGPAPAPTPAAAPAPTVTAQPQPVPPESPGTPGIRPVK